jgi:transposase InsO family protein
LREYGSVLELIQRLSTYFGFYNEERPHSAFEARTPTEVYDSNFGTLRAAS